MTVSFKVPRNIVDSDKAQLLLLIDLKWFTESDEYKFEIMINSQVVEGDADSELYHVPIPTSLIMSGEEEENQVKIVVKSGLSALQVKSFDMCVKVLPQVAEANKALKRLRTATLEQQQVVEKQEIMDGENGGSIFDPEAQTRDQVVSEANSQAELTQADAKQAT